MLLAYFGPETVLPLTSVLAAVVGVGLMLGRHTLSVVLWPFRKLFGRQSTAVRGSTTRASEPTEVPAPHFSVTAGSALERRRAARETGVRGETGPETN